MAKKRHQKKPTKRVQKSSSHRLVTALGLIATIIVVGLLAYSTYAFKNSTYEQEGFITCDTEGAYCEESKHIHADIEVSLCGEEIQFPKKKGHTDKQHTHKERNKIHWHARIPVDPQAHTYVDPAPRQLARFFEQMELSLPTSCPTNATPTTTVTVNDKNTEEGLDYVWQDGDVIHVIVE